MNPRTVCLLPAHLVHDLGQRRAVVPLEQGDHLGRLATFAHSLGLRFGRGRLLGPGGLGGRLGFLRRNDGRLYANGGHSLGDFGSTPLDWSTRRTAAGSAAGASPSAVSALIDPTGGSEPGAAAARSPRPWMAFQMRSVATFLRYRLDAGQTVPDFHQPLGVGADQVGELYFVGKDSTAGIAGGIPGSVDGDVVFCVDRKVLHFRLLYRGRRKCRD